jgi:hypothetical protein
MANGINCGYISPSFDESATITLLKADTTREIKFLILTRDLLNKPIDTFYHKRITLTKKQYEKFDSLVLQKMKMKQPPQNEGCCDGIYFRFKLINNEDTALLHFGNLIGPIDTISCKFISDALDNIESLYKDSVITDYINDIESYIDTTKIQLTWKENRPINRLRKIEFSR